MTAAVLYVINEVLTYCLEKLNEYEKHSTYTSQKKISCRDVKFFIFHKYWIDTFCFVSIKR